MSHQQQAAHKNESGASVHTLIHTNARTHTHTHTVSTCTPRVAKAAPRRQCSHIDLASPLAFQTVHAYDECHQDSARRLPYLGDQQATVSCTTATAAAAGAHRRVSNCKRKVVFNKCHLVRVDDVRGVAQSIPNHCFATTQPVAWLRTSDYFQDHDAEHVHVRLEGHFVLAISHSKRFRRAPGCTYTHIIQ